MVGLRTPLLLSSLLLAACDEPHPLPGGEVIGTYTFQAILVDGGCDRLPEMEQPFAFGGTFSRCLPESTSAACAGEPGRTFFTRGEIDRDAGFDGQYLEVYPIAVPGQLARCGSERLRFEDGFRVALFSASQAQAVGLPFQCPENALDGGVPVGDGITAPGPASGGFDAPFACGDFLTTLTNEDFDGGSGVCRTDGGVALPTGTCTVLYRLHGVRQ